MRNNQTAKLVTFGNGGDTVYISRHCHITGYGSPENPHAAEPTPNRSFPDGTPVIDMRPAIETTDGFKWVMRGPMVDVDLPTGQVDRCPQPSPVLAAGVSGNAYGSLLLAHKAHQLNSADPGPLDSVDIKTYISGWRKVGARIGKYQGGVIVWEL